MKKIKRCSKCGIEKPLKEFYHDRAKKDGYYSQCKECRNDYYKVNKERISKLKKEYARKNRKKISEWQKEYQKEYFKTLNGKLAHARSNHNRRALYKKESSDMTPARWGNILQSQNNKCNRCHKRFTQKRPPIQDHIIPISKSGSLDSSNIQALSSSCNSTKKAKLDRVYIQTWSHGIR